VVLQAGFGYPHANNTSQGGGGQIREEIETVFGFTADSLAGEAKRLNQEGYNCRRAVAAAT
jgi:hypothetical protein